MIRTTGVNNTGHKFMTGVNDTGNEFITGVVDTGHKSLDTNILLNIHKNLKWL
jgi:hypothetical protein